MNNGIFPCKENEADTFLPSLKEIDMIYSRICDERSKRVFEDRLLYSISGDYRYILDILSSSDQMQRFRKQVHNGAYIYGAGIRGKSILEMFPTIEWKGLIDREKTGTIENVPIYNISKIRNIVKENPFVVVSLKEGYSEVITELEEVGFEHDRIIPFETYVKDYIGKIYFDKRCLAGVNHCDGVFMDIGSYDGTDSINAISFFSQDSMIVHAFEPDPINFQCCKERIGSIKGVRVFSYGICSFEGTAKFEESGGGSKVKEDGSISVKLTTIDRHLQNQRVGFIKMDIEGLEEDALEGGRLSISRDKPVLAISVYHKRSDIWRLPMKVLSIDPKYMLKFEHHTMGWHDTVMYALPME